MTTIPKEAILREKIVRHWEKLAEEAPHSMASHAALLHTTSAGRPIIPARHHEEWVRIAHDVENYRYVVIICPPGYAKSTWWSIIYPSWRIGVTGGKVRIGLISNTANLTWGLSREIQKTIADPKYKMVYGIGPNQRRWSQAEFWVEGALDAKNPTVQAAGIGGPIQGMRYDEIICDDLTTWENVRSDQTMEGQRNFVRNLLLKRFEPGHGPLAGPDAEGRVIAVMTRWSEHDLVPLFAELGFKIITMPALGYWDRQEIAPGLYEWGTEPLWPEQESREVLEAMREENPVSFELVMQGNPKVLGGDVFDVNLLNHAAPGDREQFRASFREVVQYVDTAGGKDRQKGDFFALATIGIRETKAHGEEVWVMDMERGRYPAPEQERKVEEEAAEWDPDLILIEDKNEGIALHQRLVERTRLPVKAYVPVKDKEFRAIPFANAVRAQKVWLPTGNDGDPLRWVRNFEMELAAFPTGPNEDQVDAASGAYAHTGSVGPRLRVLNSGSSRRRHL